MTVFTGPMPAVSVPVTITRPGDTTAYTAQDVVGNSVATGGAVLTFPNVRPAGAGEFLITSTSLLISDTGIITGETSYLLYLHNASPASALADNAAFDIGTTDRATFVAKVALGTPVDEGTSLLIQTDGINKAVTLIGTDLKGYLVTVGGYTPSASRVYGIVLHGNPI